VSQLVMVRLALLVLLGRKSQFQHDGGLCYPEKWSKMTMCCIWPVIAGRLSRPGSVSGQLGDTVVLSTKLSYS